MGSAAEVEVGGLYMNALELSPTRTTLEELNHPQPATNPIKDRQQYIRWYHEQNNQRKTKQCNGQEILLVTR